MPASRAASAAVALLSTLLVSGGVVQGVTGLLQVLGDEGVYSALCHQAGDAASQDTGAVTSRVDVGGDTFCKARTAEFQAIAWLGYLGMSVGQVVFGFVLAVTGPKAASIAGALFNVAGFLVLALIPEPRTDDLGYDAFYKWGLFLVSFGGVAAYLSGMCFGNLFSQPSTFIAFQTGAFVAAGWDFVGLALLFSPSNPGVTRRTVFLCYAGVAALFLVLFAIVFPSKAYAAEPNDTGAAAAVENGLSASNLSDLQTESATREKHAGSRSASAAGVQSLAVSRLHDEHPQSRAPHARTTSADQHRRVAGSTFSSDLAELVHDTFDHETRGDSAHVESAPLLSDKSTSTTLSSQLLQVRFVLYALFFGFTLLSQTFYASSVADQLLRKGDHGKYITLFGLLSNAAFPLNPVFGVLLRRRLGFAKGVVLAIVLTQLAIAMNYVDSLPWQIVAFISLSAARAAFFSTTYAYGAHGFDDRWYGAVIGVVMACGVAVGLIQPCLTKWALNDGYEPVNGTLLAVLTLLQAFALSIYFHER